MKVGDLVKRRGQEWYAIIIGFRTEIVFPTMGKTEKLEAGHTGYPILVWVDLDGGLINRDEGGIDSCSASLLEVLQSPSERPLDALIA
jgi:hypothetical protein|tara:strand:+ start:537 stop:800 length:264 start_codon:yes stop_codon:yes gene_type:complete